MKSKIQLLESEITTRGSLVRLSDELDRNYAHLVGIAMLDTISPSHEFRSSTIEGREVFPKNFEVAFLQSSHHVSPKDRFFPLREQAGGNRIEIEFQDRSPEVSFSPYTLKIYLLLHEG